MFVSLRDIHNACVQAIGANAPCPETLSKLIRRLFNVQSTCPKNIKGDKGVILFKNLSPRAVTSDNSCVRLPPMCTVQETIRFFAFKCPLPYLRDSVQVNCTVGFEPGNFWMQVEEKKLSTGFSVPLTQSNIDGIIHLISTLNVCKGFPKDDDYFPRSFKEEKFSATFEAEQVSVMRSEYCSILLEWFAKQDVCSSCNISRVRKTVRKRKHPESSNDEKSECKENVKIHCPLDMEDKEKKKDSTTVKSVLKELNQNIQSSNNGTLDERSNEDWRTDSMFNPNLTSKETDAYIVLNKQDDKDMEDIVNLVLKQEGLPENFGILLKSQLQNCARHDFDKRQRRWDPKLISLCLTLYIRSPQAYEDLKKSNFLVLPSKRLLRYYKNSVKQTPGFIEENLVWMTKEMDKQNVSEFGRHGGLIIDEMTVQDDLIITKSGDGWDLIGFVDMGRTNNNIDIICKGKKEVKLATHVLQFVFHGLTGFRWPVVFFGSNPGTAHQIYNIFWECVDKLGDRDVQVDYFMTDGASTNRKFAGMLFPHPDTPRSSDYIFSDIFFPQHKMVYIQDVMHCLKKVRNNIESSKLQHKTKAGRYLLHEKKCIVWEHWEESFNFNFQGGFSIHRKLTEEHINLTPASKMRNELAIQVLNKDMLFLMKSYQSTLKNPENLASSIKLLEHTSKIVDIFCTTRQPITSLDDQKFESIKNTLSFFNSWEDEVEKSVMHVTSKNLMTQETRSDLNSSLMGFVSLCKLRLNGKNSINPGYLNSDIVENLFGQQRGIRNGLNTNPTLAQYGPSNTAIILGQCTVSNKSNSSLKASFYSATTPCALNTVRNKSNKSRRRGIRL